MTDVNHLPEPASQSAEVPLLKRLQAERRANRKLIRKGEVTGFVPANSVHHVPEQEFQPEELSKLHELIRFGFVRATRCASGLVEYEPLM